MHKSYPDADYIELTPLLVTPTSSPGSSPDESSSFGELQAPTLANSPSNSSASTSSSPGDEIQELPVLSDCWSDGIWLIFQGNLLLELLNAYTEYNNDRPLTPPTPNSDLLNEREAPIQNESDAEACRLHVFDSKFHFKLFKLKSSRIVGQT